jgi:hypothetical protein
MNRRSFLTITGTALATSTAVATAGCTSLSESLGTSSNNTGTEAPPAEPKITGLEMSDEFRENVEIKHVDAWYDHNVEAAPGGGVVHSYIKLVTSDCFNMELTVHFHEWDRTHMRTRTRTIELQHEGDGEQSFDNGVRYVWEDYAEVKRVKFEVDGGAPPTC